MVVSLFGESPEDQRDFRIGLAGLLAGTHALRILAENGLASATEIATSLAGVKQLLDKIPTWRAGEREQLEEMFDKITLVAARNYGAKND
jgi:hypothetical protein